MGGSIKKPNGYYMYHLLKMRYGLNLYVLFRRNSIIKGLKEQGGRVWIGLIWLIVATF
jgi:hypothetical protein